MKSSLWFGEIREECLVVIDGLLGCWDCFAFVGWMKGLVILPSLGFD